MSLVLFIWLAVALILWGHFKLTNKIEGWVEGSPQSTLPGALLWPWFFGYAVYKAARFYLSVFISNFKAKQ